ncbi:MAG: LysM peptidoglycan-binding domain-containing protein [Patescibacteria group bacterium]
MDGKVERQVAPGEGWESLVLKTVETAREVWQAWNKLPRKTRVVAAGGALTALAGLIAWRLEGGQILPPVVSPVEGKEITREVSAAEIPPAPELIGPQTPPEHKEVDKQVPWEELELWGKEEPQEETPEPTTYTVKKGDTLIKIAKEHGNIPWQIIYNMNRKVIGNNPDLIKPGQELSIIHWGPVEASHDFAYKKTEEALARGEKINWVYFTLGKEATVQEVADFFGINAQELAKLNRIDNSATPLLKDYYLMIPIGKEGFAFSEADRKAGRRWIPMPGISLGAVWWVRPTGLGPTGPCYPNEAYVFEAYRQEYWVEETWSTAWPFFEQNPQEFRVREITNEPYDITIGDYQGNVVEVRKGFKVIGQRRLWHTEYRPAKAGQWIGGLM